MRKIVPLFFFVLYSFFTSNSFAQSDAFNVDAYKQFLQSHQNLTSEQLLDMYSAGTFEKNLNLNYQSALYFDSIDIKFNLTDYEKELIAKNGFMVSERLSKISFGQALFEIYDRDLPVFVSVDAILHAFHISYDRILKDIELGILIDNVKKILEQLHSKMPQLEAKYSSSQEMIQMLKDVDLYITVPRRLFDESASPYYPDNNIVADEIISEIMNGNGFRSYTLFSENCRIMDWSQFRPRGHYDSEQLPILRQYFRVMMWLGRTEIYLLAPRSYPDDCKPQTFNDIKRQTIDAFLINELFELSVVQGLYDEVEDIIQFFAGHSDNVTLPNIQFLKNAVGINNASELLDSLKLIEFQDTLKNQSFAYQLILSQVLISDPFTPDSIIPASAFMLFGQRFVIDSYVTGSVVYDRILYNNEKICRLFPSTQDVLFSLGNDASVQLLPSELNDYHYSSNLAALRYLIDSYDSGFWKSTLYNSWLGCIRSVNPPTERGELPGFMQTAAFWQQKMNTQLSSWAQLRHDNLLYAKQSYTGGTLCSFPYSYVEPFPEFFDNLKTIAELGHNKFQVINIPQPYYTDILEYFSFLENVSDTLEVIARKELEGTQLTLNETNFLKRMIYDQISESGTPPFKGWYAKLLYRDFEHGNKGLMELDHIVADIHTVPTDCFGGITGWIPHVGTGPINLGVVVTGLPDGQQVAFIGPFMSYYEYVTDNFKRLTDEEWKWQYLNSALRPSWVNLYLADNNGNSKGDGLQLLTSVEEDPSQDINPNTYLIARNYPNPFNPSTIISFSIPFDLSNSKTELVVYNIQGEVIKKLVDEVLPSGNYVTRWDGTNESGMQVTSGVYIYNLRVADRNISGKMTLMK